MFFDLLNDFVFIYRKDIGPKIVEFVKKLVVRTKLEQDQLIEDGEKSNYIVNQGWNVLRGI